MSQQVQVEESIWVIRGLIRINSIQFDLNAGKWPIWQLNGVLSLPRFGVTCLRPVSCLNHIDIAFTSPDFKVFFCKERTRMFPGSWEIRWLQPAYRLEIVIESKHLVAHCFASKDLYGYDLDTWMLFFCPALVSLPPANSYPVCFGICV